jgi:hypothetical protein
VPSIFDALTAYFASRGQPISQVAGEPCLHFRVHGEIGGWSCFAMAREAESQFVFYSVCEDCVPHEARPSMSELLTRVNFGLQIGNFEMDWNTGAIRFKTSIDVEGDRLSPALIEGVVNANLITMDRYLRAIRLALQDGLSAAEAVAAVEGFGKLGRPEAPW